MTFDKRSLKAIYAALHGAIEWELSLAEAYGHMKDDPVYKRAMRKAKSYEKLRLRIKQEVSQERRTS